MMLEPGDLCIEDIIRHFADDIHLHGGRGRYVAGVVLSQLAMSDFARAVGNRLGRSTCGLLLPTHGGIVHVRRAQ